VGLDSDRRLKPGVHVEISDALGGDEGENLLQNEGDATTVKKTRRTLMLVLILTISIFACDLSTQGGPPSNAVVLDVIMNTALKPWLEDKKPIYIPVISMDAGEAVTSIVDGDQSPAIWIPDDPVWVDVLANEGVPDFQGDCMSIAESPLVIAMWRPVAEALGWPGRELGWLDIGSLAADPSAWDYYSGGQFGASLRLGHTHPGLSSTGAETLLAVVQAAQSEVETVSVQDIQQPIVQASVGAFEGAVSWFSKDTDTLGETMAARGIQFLGAAVVYESTVIYYGSGDPDIVPIYPFEGTYVSSHPACVNGAVDAQKTEAALLFRDYLVGEEGQEKALETGLRPVSSQVPIGEPLVESRGVHLTEPAVVFSSPSAEAIYAIQELWQSARKDVNLVMLLDVSGSMEGDKIASMRDAAVQFVNQMGDEDYITLIAFADTPEILLYHEMVGTARDRLVSIIRGLDAWGDTTLYDAIADGSLVISNTTSSQRTNALVVLTDGMDTASTRYVFNQELIELAAANSTTIFTIAYGSDADETLLLNLATQANGNFYLGDEASIVEIYDEMSAAFGGAVGVGR
jgi:Ca-activated chloride channel family protein